MAPPWKYALSLPQQEIPPDLCTAQVKVLLGDTETASSIRRTFTGERRTDLVPSQSCPS